MTNVVGPMDFSTFVHRELTFAPMVDILRGAGFDLSEARSSHRTLLDTADGRLFSAGLTLQVVSTTGDHPETAHMHLEQDGSVPATIAVEAIPRMAEDLPAGPLGTRLRKLLDVRALLPLVTFDVRAATAVERDSDGRASAAVTVADEIVLHEPGTAARVPCTVTITPALGQPKPAERISDQLLALGFERSSSDLLGLVTDAAVVDRRGIRYEASVPLEPHMPAGAGFRAVLINLLDTIEANWQGTIADLDTEFLHDLRVAVRRTRSVIGQAKRVLPESLRGRYRDDFAWLAGATGPTRDLDAYALEWPRYVADMSDGNDALQPVLDHILRHRHVARAELVAVLESERAHTLLAEWRIAMATEPVDRPSHADERLGVALAKRFRQAHQTVLHQGRLIDSESPAEHLHDLRKDAKKLRYLVECFASAMPAKLLRRFVKQLKGLQDNLGEHQDAEVHAEELTTVGQELSEEHAPQATLIALGALTERLEQSQHAARAEFVERFAAYDSADTQRIVDALIEALEQ